MEYNRAHIEKTLVDARFHFALECLQKTMQIKPTENFLLSPHNIYETLVLTYIGPCAATKEYLKEILHLSNISQYNLLKYYLSIKCFELKSQNENIDYIYGQYDKYWIDWEASTHPLAPRLFSTYCVSNFQEPDPLNERRINNWLRRVMGSSLFIYPFEFTNITNNMEHILSTGFYIRCIKRDVPNTLPIQYTLKNEFIRIIFELYPRSIFSYKLSMLVIEITYIKYQPLFLLFPIKIYLPGQINNSKLKWKNDEDIPGFIERLTTKEGADELRKVLDDTESFPLFNTTRKPYPHQIHLEKEFPIDHLLKALGVEELLSDKENRLTEKNVRLSGAIHRAHINAFTSPAREINAGACTIFFTENEGSIQPIWDEDRIKYKHSFILLSYDKYRHTILFIGVINKNTQ